jgi:predicted GIY-YIG superfamily endonuclease
MSVLWYVGVTKYEGTKSAHPEHFGRLSTGLSKGERIPLSGATMTTTFWVYILQCSDGSYYTGHTDNLEARLHQHDAGTFEGYTHSRRPVKLVYQQMFSTREDAFAAEWKIKGWSRKKKEAMMRGDWGEVSRLARGHAHASTGSA